MTKIACYVSFLLGIAAIAESASTPVVQTESGPVRGITKKSVRHQVDYSAFIGIPFAEPPVGQLRFKPPVKKKSWTDVYEATKDADACPQYLSSNSSVVGAEDCLYLNVYSRHLQFTNIKDEDLKAVMVWFYGGSFISGLGSFAFYRPDFLMEDDVVLVTLNYRLGAFGFLNLDHDDAVGNAGLKDQNLALKWVNENIKKFGGDPNRITIFGQSAGGASVDYHILSEMSTGLFHRSIAMSGSALCLYWASESRLEAVAQAFKLASRLGTNTLSKDRVLQALYNASVEDIILKSNELGGLPFRPTVENANRAKNEEKFLTKCAVDKFKSGEFNKAPHILGFTSLEAKASADSGIINSIRSGIESLTNLTNINIPLLEQFLNLRNLSNLPDKVVKDIIQYASDLFWVTGIDSKQKLMERYNEQPIYYYQFSFEGIPYYGIPPGNSTIGGVGHAEDVPYLFYISFGGMPLDDPKIQAMVDKYVRLFTNFAKYGNPTPNGTEDPLLNVNWPYSGKEGKHLEVNKALTTGPRPVTMNVRVNQLLGLGTSRTLNGC